MRASQKEGESRGVSVELKYCEHCGGLWVRESGGGVYCGNCQSKVAELPIPKKKPGSVRVSNEPDAQLGEYPGEFEEEDFIDLEAAGGAA